MYASTEKNTQISTAQLSSILPMSSREKNLNVLTKPLSSQIKIQSHTFWNPYRREDFSKIKMMLSPRQQFIDSNMLKRIRSFSILFLDFSGNNEVNEKTIKILSSSLRHLNSITTLTLNFSNCPEINDSALACLFSGFKFLKFLSIVTLDISLCPLARAKGIESLFEGLKFSKSLSSLSLTLAHCRIGNSTIKNLASRLMHLCTLSSLNINFKRLREHLEIQNITSSLQSFRSLSSLTLNFAYICKITDQQIRSFSDGLKQLNFLLTLSLNFTHCYITDLGIEALSSALQYLNNLSTITIVLLKCRRITIKGIQNLSSTLKYLHCLLSIHLYFSFTMVESSNEDIKSLFSSLICLKTLSTLCIHIFPGSEIDTLISKKINIISSALKQLRSLSTLNIYAFGFEWVSDKEVKQLFSSISSLSSLSSLKLFFNGLSNTGKQNLSLSLRSFPLLSKLSLVYYQSFSSKEVENLTEILKDLRFLSCLTVDFSDSCMHGQTMLRLSSSLSHLTSLSTLELDFSWCNEVGNQALECLSFGLTYLSSLSKLSLNFSGCSSVDDSGVKSLLTRLIYFKILSNLYLKLSNCNISDIESIKRDMDLAIKKHCKKLNTKNVVILI